MAHTSKKRREQIAAAVKNARVKQGLSQEQLAARAGVYKGTVGNLERGSHDTSPDTLEAIERVLELDLSPAALAAGSAISLATAEVERRYAELSEPERLMFLGNLLTFITRWQPELPPTARLDRAGFEARLRAIPGITERQVSEALRDFNSQV